MRAITSNRKRAAVAVLVAAMALAAVSATARAPASVAAAAEPVVIYRKVHLIDGTGGPSRSNMAVVVRGERIEAVLPDDRLTARRLAGAEVVDLDGLYMLPGLIDSHEHLRPGEVGKAMMQRDLYSGVTAVRDMANDYRELGPLVDGVKAGRMQGPDIFYAALVGGPSLFENPKILALSKGLPPGTAAWSQAIDEHTDLPAAIARSKSTGATAVKIYANLPPEMVTRIAHEAHRQGLMVWTHAAVFPARPKDSVDAGADTISHVCDLAYQISPTPPQRLEERFPVDVAALSGGDNPQIAALYDDMRQRGTILDATNRIYIGQDKRAAQGKPGNCSADLAARLTAQAYRAGVEVSTGTDGVAPADNPFPALYDELFFLVDKAGITPAKVIRSATLVGAKAAGQDKQMGTITPGKLANLMIVRDDPLKDIHALSTVVTTVKRGKAYPRADYHLPTAPARQ